LMFPATAFRREAAPNESARDVLFRHGIDIIDVHRFAPEQTTVQGCDLVRDFRSALDRLSVPIARFTVTIHDAPNVRVLVGYWTERQLVRQKELWRKADGKSGAVTAVLLPLQFRIPLSAHAEQIELELAC
jgi:hypothetical protein